MLANVNCIIYRGISTSVTCSGKRNFRKFLLYNKRGTRIFKDKQSINADPRIPIDKRGVRDIGCIIDGKFTIIPEMIPQLIVPDLTDCKLKPYVSYKVPDIIQSEFTAQDLFNSIYAEKIVEDFKNDQLNEDGNPKNPSKDESQSPEEARLLARKIGSDIF